MQFAFELIKNLVSGIYVKLELRSRLTAYKRKVVRVFPDQLESPWAVRPLLSMPDSKRLRDTKLLQLRGGPPTNRSRNLVSGGPLPPTNFP